MKAAGIERKRTWGVVALLAVVMLGCMLIATPAAYAAEKAGFSLQSGEVSAQASGVTEILIDRCTLDEDGDCNYYDVGYVYRDGTAASVAGVSYNPATKTITLNNCNDPSYGLNVEGSGCDITIQVNGQCQMNAFWIYGVGVNVTGEGTLILNSKKLVGRSVYMGMYNSEARGFHVASTVTMQLYGKATSYGTAGCVAIDETSLPANQAIRFDGLVSAYNVKTEANPTEIPIESEVYFYDESDDDYWSSERVKLDKGGTVYYGYYDDDDELWYIYEVVDEHEGLPVVEWYEDVKGTVAKPNGYTVVDLEKVPATFNYTITNEYVKQDRRGAATGATAVVGGATYKVTNDAKATVIFAKGKKSAKNATVPASVTIKGKSYAVTGIGANAFKGAKAKTLVVRSKKLTKKSVKGSLKGSKVKVVKVKVGSKKVNKKYVKKYKKIFTKKICGKKVKVK